MYRVAGIPFSGRLAEKRAWDWAQCLALAHGRRIKIQEVVNGRARPFGYVEPLTVGQALDMEASVQRERCERQNLEEQYHG